MALHDDFIRGFAAAAATLARDHGCPYQAACICRSNGLSLAEAGVEKFDLSPIEKELALLERKP
jgi:hypothetical protein